MSDALDGNCFKIGNYVRRNACTVRDGVEQPWSSWKESEAPPAKVLESTANMRVGLL